jgi:type IV secretion system protein TrbL
VNDLGVIDHFLSVFSSYIDSGFGLLGGEVSYLTATLVAIDITLAGLFWAMGGTDDVLAKLIKKVLYVGAFAFIITHFNALASIIFRSFAGLGLIASGTSLTASELLHPGRVAAVGVDAGRPILAQIGDLVGFPGVFLNLDSVVVLFLAWLVVIVSFFVLSVQLFVTLIEFKLTTLAGFVLVPFALWNRTAFLAERVLGNVVASGVKVLVLAVIIGIGSGLFADFRAPIGTEPSIDTALAVMLAALAMLGLGLFGPGIANGLVSGAPQLGGGAAAGTALGAAGLAVAGGAALGAGAGLLSKGASSAVASAASLSARAKGAAGAEAGAASVLAAAPATATAAGSTSAPGATPAQPPDWAKRLQHRRSIAQGASTAAHVWRASDHGGSGTGPHLDGGEERSS